jgi:N-acetyl-anhydromuramyl-L-alanine amidase AmpD
MTYVFQTWLADELRAGGCKVKTYQGWKERGRPSSTFEFDPFGLLLHHTGAHTTMSNPAPSIGTCIHGTSKLEGPLAQVMIGRDGLCHLIAAGRANHAGTNDGVGSGPIPFGDGNKQMIGFEIDYSGSQDMSDDQYAAVMMASAVVLRHFDTDEKHVRGHKETSKAGKWDPGRDGSLSPEYRMDDIRADIAKVLRGEEIEMTVKVGDSGSKVRHLQLALNNWSKATDQGFTIAEDGKWEQGSSMTRHVKAFQKVMDLDETGRVDGLTAAYLLRFNQPRYWEDDD